MISNLEKPFGLHGYSKIINGFKGDPLGATLYKFILYPLLGWLKNTNKRRLLWSHRLRRGNKMKWNESGFRPPLCTYRLNWARGTSWGWWDDWDDTVLQTQDSKFKPLRSEAEHATSRSRRLPTILTFTRGWGRNIFSFFQTAETGNRTPDSGVKGSGANHYPRAPALRRGNMWYRMLYRHTADVLAWCFIYMAIYGPWK